MSPLALDTHIACSVFINEKKIVSNVHKFFLVLILYSLLSERSAVGSPSSKQKYRFSSNIMTHTRSR